MTTSFVVSPPLSVYPLLLSQPIALQNLSGTLHTPHGIVVLFWWHPIVRREHFPVSDLPIPRWTHWKTLATSPWMHQKTLPIFVFWYRCPIHHNHPCTWAWERLPMLHRNRHLLLHPLPLLPLHQSDYPNDHAWDPWVILHSRRLVRLKIV